jgi:hypothetical protein
VNRLLISSLALAPIVLALGCGDDSDGGGGGGGSKGCDLAAQTGCAAGQVCEEVAGGEPACFAPVTFAGQVTNALDGSAIAGAHVVARDANGAAISRVAVSDADGHYALVVSAPRGADGLPTSAAYTLRADASDFAPFPAPPRVALPIDVASASGEPPVVESAATDIALLPLADTTGLGTVSGTVLGDTPGGALVVAGAVTAIADLDGAYTLFNVPAGSSTVEAYSAGTAYVDASADVTADAETTGVDLAESDEATATLSGKVEIVNGGGSSITSVVLAVESTFLDALGRGEVPKGLRVGDVSGDFSLTGVPPGDYVVLAAFENDGLVRDPDTSIGGTETLHVTLTAGQDLAAGSFKVTGALAVLAPGKSGLDVVTAPPTLSWEDDSSEDEYLVQVHDALGTLVWETSGNFDPGGSAPVTLPYAGDPLVAGMIYQFRAVSLKSGVPISATEDLLGVFAYQP